MSTVSKKTAAPRFATTAIRKLLTYWSTVPPEDRKRLRRLFPKRIRVWLQNRLMQQRVRRGFRALPEGPLMRSYREALASLTRNQPASALGDYFEFGVYCGTSMACMYRALEEAGLGQVRLFGFDSFEGLPSMAAAESEGIYQRKQFQSSIEFAREFLTQQKVDLNRVTLVKGWFSDTLNAGLVNKYKLNKASVIMIDCDIYSSTKEALAFCGPLIRDEAVMVFADWNIGLWRPGGGLAEKKKGQKLAFDEFLSENPQFTVAEELVPYTDWSKVFLISNKCQR